MRATYETQDSALAPWQQQTPRGEPARPNRILDAPTGEEIKNRGARFWGAVLIGSLMFILFMGLITALVIAVLRV